MSDTRGTCRVCGSQSTAHVVAQNGWQIVRCLRCGHRFVWPLPSESELAAIYDESYYHGCHRSMGFRDYGALRGARARMFARHLDRLEKHLRHGRALDVGCATGDFLKIAQTRGWDVLGVDPSPAGRQAATVGFRIVGRTIDDAAVDAGSLDLVTFWDVLEHLPDPVHTLRRAIRLLAPGGIIAATVPNSGSPIAKISGRRWFGYKTAGEHLQFFTAATLAKTFETAGLDVIAHYPVGWSCTIGFLLDRAAEYLGAPGRVVNAVLGGSGLAPMILDVPHVNQFIIGRPRVSAQPHAA